MFSDTNLRKNRKDTMASITFFVIFSLIVLTKNHVYGDEIMEETLKRTLPAYAVALDAEALNSTACARELRIFRDAVEMRKLWALKMLDSSGEPKPGFIYGNNFWLGTRTQCVDSTNKKPFLLNKEHLKNWTMYRKPEDEFPPFNLNYYVAHFRENSTLQYHVRLLNEDLVTLGLCLPASCTTNELATILERLFQKRTLMVSDLYAADFELINVRDLKDDHMWLLTPRFMIVGIILLLSLTAMAVGTAYDVLVYQKYLTAKKDLHHDNYQNNIAANGVKTSIRNAESLVPVAIKRPSLLGEILKCFSIYSNTKIIFNTKLSSDSVAVVHGLRFLGMVWIIMIHTIFYMADFAENRPLSWRTAEGFAVQVISNATLSVDTFFFLSGFLVGYLYYKGSLKNKKENDKVNYKAKAIEFFGAVLKRFIRLTPAYMMMIGIVEMNAAWYGETSQFYTSERPQDNCATYWWRNLLYINNFFGREQMCLSWSWYLSNDMQFFVLGTFIVVLSSVYFYTAITTLVLVLFSSTLLTGYISYIYGYVPTMDEQFWMLDVLYDPPWTRIGPYLVGIVTAYILVKTKNKLTIGKRYLVILWTLGSACNVVVLFGLYQRYISVLTSAFYVALSRTVWGIGLAWLTIACTTNNGGIVNSILSFKAWIPLSRLTYCAYLLNPFLITSVYLNGESALHVDFLPNGAVFLGNLGITYCCSYAYSLMMETPYVLLMRLLTTPRVRNR